MKPDRNSRQNNESDDYPDPELRSAGFSASVAHGYSPYVFVGSDSSELMGAGVTFEG